MPVRFSCPQCSSKLTVGRQFAGQRGRCPNCKAKVTVPAIDIGDPVSTGDNDTGNSAADTFGDSGVSSERGEVSLAAIPRRRRSSSDSSAWLELIQLPRWVVYVQGALLGIVATTFFVFGLAVGNNTSGGGRLDAQTSSSCVVAGRVYYDQGPERRADYGAVVILLPVDKAPQERPDPGGLRPIEFEPINNPAIEVIRGLGGSVVRADPNGKFETEVKGSKSYWLLVISRNQAASTSRIGKQTRSELGAYFFPIEDLLGDRAFQWSKVRISGPSRELRTVTF